MLEFLSKIGRQITEFFSSLSPLKRLAVLGTGVVILASLGGIFYWAGDRAYVTLMKDLSPEDSANVIRVLREKNVPFKVSEGGKKIEVSPEGIHDLRFELATKGLPESGSVGYEIFDKNSLGTTSFVNQVNQKRALEGELMRTIQTVKGVKRSRVHLVIPKKSTFIEDEKKPTASVFLDLDPGRRLEEKQIYGIGVLVASAVEGLNVEDVTIVDSRGNVLSKNSRDPLISMSATQLDFKRGLEKKYESQVEDMLSRVVGEGSAVVRVYADLDFSRVSETQTLYDADGSAVRSELKDNHTMRGTRPSPRGPAGVASNTPDDPNASDYTIRSNTDRNRDTINYEIPTTVRKVISPYGSVKKLSVAVLIDGKRTVETAEDGTVNSKVTPWAPEKLKEFETIVSKSLGLDLKRGDTIEIKNMEFTRTDFEGAEQQLQDAERRSYIRNIVKFGIIGLIIALFFMFVVRPFIKWITENTIDSVESFLPQTIEELEKLQRDDGLPGLEDTAPNIPEKLDPDKVEGEMIKEKIITLVDGNPQKAALILRDWLHVDEKKKKMPAQEGTA